MNPFKTQLFKISNMLVVFYGIQICCFYLVNPHEKRNKKIKKKKKEHYLLGFLSLFLNGTGIFFI